MVVGLPKFREHFAGLEDCFILIGGTACDLWLGDHNLPFRATEDLDMVLVVENLPTHPEFFARFWEFIRLGGYDGFHAGETPKNLYRFENPQSADFPVMIELLSRSVLDVPTGIRIVRVPSGGGISSLSAILLDAVYYDYVRQNRIVLEGVSTITANCLIPLKARAHLDLSARREAGDTNVKTRDIKKHRHVVFRLLRGIAADERFTLPAVLRDDLARFIAKYPPASPEWIAIRQAVPNLPDDTAAILAQLRENFHLEAAQP